MPWCMAHTCMELLGVRRALGQLQATSNLSEFPPQLLQLGRKLDSPNTVTLPEHFQSPTLDYLRLSWGETGFSCLSVPATGNHTA